MAVLKVTNELIKDRPDLLDVLGHYFEDITELLSDEQSVRKFSVKKDGLPNDSTVVECICSTDAKGNIIINSCK